MAKVSFRGRWELQRVHAAEGCPAVKEDEQPAGSEPTGQAWGSCAACVPVQNAHQAAVQQESRTESRDTEAFLSGSNFIVAGTAQLGSYPKN